MTGEPPLGTIGVVSTLDGPGTLLERFVSRAIQWDCESPVNHAFLYTGQGQILEARPGGSGFSPWDAYPGTIWLTDIQPPDRPPLVLASVALSLSGIPYSFMDILAIGIAQKRWSPELAKRWDGGHAPWWVRRVSGDGHEICSQLADEFYRRLGCQLFSDGRLPGLISPGDLLRLNQSLV